MKILIPMDSDDTQEGSLVALNDVVKWALVTHEEGQVVEVIYADNRETFNEWIDAVVVINDNEYVWPFMEEQIMVLVAHTQRSMDDVIEAFLFKELHELAY